MRYVMPMTWAIVNRYKLQGQDTFKQGDKQVLKMHFSTQLQGQGAWEHSTAGGSRVRHHPTHAGQRWAIWSEYWSTPVCSGVAHGGMCTAP
mmetsp:Transcript_100752/g.174055  ORF Transcript_100752/g.174055 Transcript_100752/m.174055 type:complete len:91 (+) Transcript_100752:856-1128(+)